MLDPLKTDAAERQLNALLDRAAAKVGEKRAGQQAANELEEFWAASERRLREMQREAHRWEWIRYFESLAANHAQLSEANRQKAEALQAVEDGGA